MANLTNLNNKFLVTTGGAVLINQTSAVSTHLLTVNGKIGGPTFSDSYLQFTGGNAVLKANDDVKFGYSQNVVVKQSGSVGIGTTSPASKLDISGGRIGIRNNIVAASNLTYSTIYSTENTGAAYPFTGTSGNLVVEPRNGQDFVVLGTSGVARMVVEGGGNVGIGTTTPNEKLVVGTTGGTQNIEISNNFIQSFNRSGSAGYQNLNFYASSYAFNVGNVGIGITNPQKNLHIFQTEGGVGAKHATIRLGGYLTVGPDIAAYRVTGNSNDQGLIFSTYDATNGTVDTMTLTNAGNVGIGTTSPSGKLDVKGDGADIFLHSNDYKIARIQPRGTGGNYDIGLFSLFSGSTENVRIDAGGNSWFNGGDVGIGTTSPGQKLDVRGGNIMVGGFGGGTDYGLILTPDDGSGYWNIANVTGGALTFNNSNTIGSSEAMRITGGNVGIGTTTPGTVHGVSYGTTKLHVDGGTDRGQLVIEGDTLAGIAFSDNGATANQRVFYQDVDGGLFNIRPLNDNGTSAASSGISMLHGGNVGINTTSPTAKLEIVTASGADAIRANFGQSSDIFIGFNSTNPRILLQDNSNVVTHDFTSNANNYIVGSNLGIGTTSPSEKLYVASSAGYIATFQSTTATDFRPIRFLNSAGANVGFLGNNGSNNEFFLVAQDRPLIFGTGNGGAERMRIDSSGYVIHKGPTGAGTNLQESWYYGTDSNFRLDLKQIVSSGLVKHSFNIVNNGASYNNNLVLDRGNVGIGTTTPTEKLSINAGVAAITAGPTVRISKGASPVGSIAYDTLVIEADDVPTIRFGENDGTVSTIMSGDSNLRINSTSPIKFYTAGTTTGPGHSGQGGTFAMIINNSQNVGIGNTNPTTKLTVQGVITAGDSTTNAVIRRQHQTFATMKPGPTSGGSVDMMFVDHTHSLDITVVAYINTSNVATGRGYSVAAYGSASAGLTQTSFAGNVSALSISYVNTGGSENYILRVTCTYSGVDAPSISVTANGQSTSELRAAT